MLKIIPKITDVSEYPEYRLSATSAAFHEKHPERPFYKVVRIDVDFDTEFLEITEKPTKERITNAYRFQKPLYVNPKKEIGETLETVKRLAERFKKGNPVEIERRFADEKISQGSLLHAFHFQDVETVVKETCYEIDGVLHMLGDALENLDEEELTRMIVKTAKEKFTKIHRVYDDHGNEIFSFRCAKNEYFPEEWEEFEKLVKRTYGISDDEIMLFFPKGHENSETEYWDALGYDYEPHYREVDGFAFVKKDFIERVNEERNASLKKSLLETLEKIEKMKKFEPLGHSERSFLEREAAKSFPDLKKRIDEALKRYERLKTEFMKKELKRYADEAENFLRNGLYVLPPFENPPEPPVGDDVLDPFYYYSRTEEAGAVYMDNLIKYGDSLERAMEAREKMKMVFSVESRAGYFYAMDGEKKWKIKVDPLLAGKFIGKGGRNVKQLEKTYNVKIEVDSPRKRRGIDPKGMVE